MKKITTLNDLLIIKLQALYDIENQLIKALPKMAKAATDEELAKGFEEHLEETKEQAKRLEVCFQHLKVKPQEMEVEGIAGIIADAEWMIKQKPGPEALDSALIAAAASVEHYEMSKYITASKWANMLGLTDVTDLLAASLEEEIAAEEKMSMMAEERIDAVAMNIAGEEEMDTEEK